MLELKQILQYCNIINKIDNNSIQEENLESIVIPVDYNIKLNKGNITVANYSDIKLSKLFNEMNLKLYIVHESNLINLN